METKRIMFVCMGNICRSPLAHAYMEKLLKDRSLDKSISIDSSGIGEWHVGFSSDERVREVGEKNGLKMTHKAQQFTSEHAETFNVIFAMDQQNYVDILQRINPMYKKKVFLFRAFDTVQTGGNVADPYYGGADGFESCYDIVARNCQLILKEINEGKLRSLLQT